MRGESPPLACRGAADSVIGRFIPTNKHKEQGIDGADATYDRHSRRSSRHVAIHAVVRRSTASSISRTGEKRVAVMRLQYFYLSSLDDELANYNLVSMRVDNRAQCACTISSIGRVVFVRRALTVDAVEHLTNRRPPKERVARDAKSAKTIGASRSSGDGISEGPANSKGKAIAQQVYCVRRIESPIVARNRKDDAGAGIESDLDSGVAIGPICGWPFCEECRAVNAMHLCRSNCHARHCK